MAELAPTLWPILPPVVLFLAVLGLLQRWMRRANRTDDGLRVLGRTGLTRSSVVAIVAVGGRRFLVGASEAGVRLLSELEPPRVDRRDEELAAAGPRTGLVDRMRDRTVRTAVGGSGHALRR